MKEENPKEWHYWMYDCVTDENGNKYGWGKVLDYIGVEWENPIGAIKGQLNFLPEAQQ